MKLFYLSAKHESGFKLCMINEDILECDNVINEGNARMFSGSIKEVSPTTILILIFTE